MVSDQIPLTPQPWNKNPDGYVRHQLLLKQFAEWCESKGLKIKLPPERDGWDLGIDLIVADTRIDLKSFGLRSYMYSHTWDSTHYRGRPAPIWKTSQTDWFVHPRGSAVGAWLAAPATALTTSKHDHEPFYPTSSVVTVHKLAQGLFTWASP